jgi:hypothetical protein
MPSLVHIVAVNEPFYAVFADPEGKPEFRKVVAMGTFEVSPDTGQRVVAGFPVGSHLMAADWMVEFVGYASEIDVEKWAEPCHIRREKINEDAESKKGKPQIYVPSGPLIFETDKLAN